MSNVESQCALRYLSTFDFQHSTLNNMILPIYLYGQPVLRKPTEDITPDSLDLQQLLSDMWETLAVAEGCGLAAPQIGKAIRLFIVDGTELAVLGADGAANAAILVDLGHLTGLESLDGAGGANL